MAIIDFSGGKAENDALLQKQNELNKLQSQANRFQYPGPELPREFDGLLGFEWDGLKFPVNNVAFNIKHTQVPHRFPHQNGALVETTGREPLIISANCLFFNTIIPANNESWKVGELWPGTYEKFLLSMSVGSRVRPLQHPYFGTFRCKPVSAKSVMDGSTRDGEIVQAQWIVTLERDDGLISSNDVSDKILAATTTASKLDDLLNPPPDALVIDTPPSFTDLMSNLQGTIDSIDRGVRSIKNVFNEPINQANKILAAASRVNSTSVETVKQAARYHKLALILLEKQIQFLTFNRAGVFTAKLVLDADSTLAEVKLDPRVNSYNSVEDLIKLNPSLTKAPILPKGTEVRYFRVASPESTLEDFPEPGFGDNL